MSALTPNPFPRAYPTPSFGSLASDPASAKTSLQRSAPEPLNAPPPTEPSPVSRSWTDCLHNWAHTIQSVFQRIGDFIQQATTLLRQLNPNTWWQPETFPRETRIHQLPGNRTPQQAAQELTPLTVGLALHAQPAYQTLTHPVEKGLRRVLSRVNNGTPVSAPNAPAAVMGLVGDDTVAKARFADVLADVAFDGDRSLRQLDLNQARTYHDVILGLQLPGQAQPALLLLSHADLNSNRHLSDADRRKTLQLLCQMTEPQPTAETSQVLADQGVDLGNALVLLSLDTHPLEAPFNPLISLAPSTSIPYWQQKLAQRATLDTPYWQAFTKDWLAPLMAAGPGDNRS